MPRNKSEHPRRRLIEAYYAALHGYWPDKMGNLNPGCAMNPSFAVEVHNTYDALSIEDQRTLGAMAVTSGRFAWMDKQLALTV